MYKEIQNLTKVITTEFAGAVKEGKSHHLTPSPCLVFADKRASNGCAVDSCTPAKIRSPYRGEGGRVKSRLTFKKRSAFTLAETLITVVILGILAAILVPNLIKNQVENANRTKVKKAMAAYEKAINMMIIENDIKSTEALRELGQDNCQYTREYFKTVQDGSSNCIFKTADRVWWDITDIANPIISLKDEITDSNKATIRVNAMNYDADKVSFALIGRFDEVGSLRVDDNGFEQSQENNDNNKKYMIKLWAFINNTQPSPDAGEIIANEPEEPLTGFAKCNAEGATTCVITVNGVDTTYTKITTNTDTIVDRYGNGGKIGCIYDRETNAQTQCNGYVSVAPSGDYWISDKISGLTQQEVKDYTGSICTSEQCANNGDYYEAAKRRCESQGAHLTSLAELSIASSNGKMSTAHGSFWASEENSANGAYTWVSNNNTVGSESKSNYVGQFFCVGD